jgi:hypothetical protein
MHYVLFVGIFGLPVVAGVGILVARVLDTFATAKLPVPGRIPTSDLYDPESHVSELVDTFFTAPLEQNPKQ